MSVRGKQTRGYETLTSENDPNRKCDAAVRATFARDALRHRKTAYSVPAPSSSAAAGFSDIPSPSAFLNLTEEPKMRKGDRGLLYDSAGCVRFCRCGTGGGPALRRLYQTLCTAFAGKAGSRPA